MSRARSLSSTLSPVSAGESGSLIERISRGFGGGGGGGGSDLAPSSALCHSCLNDSFASRVSSVIDTCFQN